MKKLLFVVASLVFIGCNGAKKDENQAYLLKDKNGTIEKLDAKSTLAKIEAQNKLETITIESEKEKELKRLDLEIQKAQETTKREQIKSDKDVQIAKNNVSVQIEEKNISLYKIIVGVVLLLVILLSLLGYFIHRRNKNAQLKIHEDELRHKEAMQANMYYNNHMSKMLDILVDEKIDGNVKQDVAKILQDKTHDSKLLLK
ncbi:MAG: hypothetical protein FNT15_04110 [Sulfurovum sp.]|nr:MAG: hypothetical protein FNT15_04110 [Sulfurovum sp.]